MTTLSAFMYYCSTTSLAIIIVNSTEIKKCKVLTGDKARNSSNFFHVHLLSKENKILFTLIY